MCTCSCFCCSVCCLSCDEYCQTYIGALMAPTVKSKRDTCPLIPLPGKCKGKIRFSYSIFVPTKRTEIVATRRDSQAQNIRKCVCGRALSRTPLGSTLPDCLARSKGAPRRGKGRVYRAHGLSGRSLEAREKKQCSAFVGAPRLSPRH